MVSFLKSIDLTNLFSFTYKPTFVVGHIEPILVTTEKVSWSPYAPDLSSKPVTLKWHKGRVVICR